jgi:hypothetical protein
VTLVAPTEEAINTDYRRIKELESQIVIEPAEQLVEAAH